MSYYGKDATINGQLRINNKLYNQVNIPTLTLTSTDTNNISYYSVTLPNPLAETTVIDTDGIMAPIWPNNPVQVLVILPHVYAETLGMTFNFIKTNVKSSVTFKTDDTINEQIITQSYTGGTTGTDTATLLKSNITSMQLIVLSVGVGRSKWVVINSSLPPQISNPVGSIITMPVNSLPEGYLYCNGAYYANIYYPDLYAVIGYTYGKINDNFYVPNFNNGSFLRGYKNGKTANIGSQQSDNIKTHTHTSIFYRTQSGGASGARAIGLDAGGGYNENPQTITNTSYNNTADSIDETRPINYAVYYCIKY